MSQLIVLAKNEFKPNAKCSNCTWSDSISWRTVWPDAWPKIPSFEIYSDQNLPQ